MSYVLSLSSCHACCAFHHVMHAVPFLITIMLSLLLLLLLLLQRTPVMIGVMVRLSGTGKQQHMIHVARYAKQEPQQLKLY